MTMRIWASLILLIFSPFSLSAASPQAIPPTPVRVVVTAEGDLREKVLQFLNEELSTIGEVSVTTQEAALTLDVIATEFRMSDARLAGYMVYAGGYQPGPAACTPQKGVNLHPVMIQWQSLKMAPPDLNAACQRVVKDFRDEVVESTRREMRRVEGQKKQ